jgi:hypothetical protein
LHVQAAADEKLEKARSAAEDTTYAAAGTEADGEEGHKGSDSSEQVTNSDEAADADAADTWSGAAAGGSGGAEEQLTDGTDLATFAAHGTHCVVTPSHGKVGGSGAKRQSSCWPRLLLPAVVFVACWPHLCASTLAGACLTHR